MKLGTLQKVPLTNVWEHEALAFTPWLAKEENLTLLGDTIGIELELLSTEAGVGAFSADIVCKDVDRENHRILIENQIKPTDHTHLGQLLTYAAGLDTATIVWISERFRDEHRAALDWLNEITSQQFNFFGIEVELLRIGNSDIAPRFNMVSKPNDWVKTLSGRGTLGNVVPLTETKQTQLQYWQALKEYLLDAGSFLKPQKALPQHWLTLSVGKRGFHIVATVNSQIKRIAIELTIDGNESNGYFRALFDQKERIEKDISAALDWKELSHKKSSRIVLYHNNTDPLNTDDWSQQHAWMQEKLELFYKVFSPRIKEL